MFARTASIAIVAALVATAGAPALAAPEMESKSIEVRYDDLNLVSASGEHRLKARVRQAAAWVCGNAGSRALKAMHSVKECRSAAIAAASRDVTRVVAAARSGSPQLAAGSGSIGVSRAAAED